MTFTFHKYQGTGNDFVIIDNRSQFFPKTDTHLIEKLCDRKFGVGGDGLILLEEHPSVDFRMIYFNADGHESSMCGNGGRCMVAFAKALGIIQMETTFEAIDGMHEAQIEDGIVHLKMQDVQDIKTTSNYAFLDTGSPHHVTLRSDLKDLDVKVEGAAMRFSNLYGEAGCNINFVHQLDSSTFAVRTYERGVEDETLSCGTGVTAVALAMHKQEKTMATEIALYVEGGQLQVRFRPTEMGYEDIYLVGPAQWVFKGEWTW
jgi:diaminopimelate epimerase